MNLKSHKESSVDKTGKMNSQKLASITITAILVISIIAVMIMPVSAQIDGGVTTTGDDRVIGGGTTETFNFTINDTRGDGATSYITYINITNQTGFTFISSSNSTNITSDFSVVGVNLTWAISGVDFNETAGWFAFNVTAPTLDNNRTDTWTTYALYNDTTVVSNTTFNVTVTENTPPAVTIDTPTESVPVYRKGGEVFYVNFTYTELNAKNYTIEIGNSTAVINSSLNESVVGGTNLFANHSFNLNSTASDGRYNVTVKMYDNASLSYTTYQNYSVIKDDTLPVITTPPDQTVEVDSTAYITWNVTDTNPNKYWVLRNGAQVVAPTDYTSGVDFNVQIDTSTLGSWNYTIFANDTVGNEATDEVIITVSPRPLAFPEFNAIGLLALISMLSITLAVTTLRRER